MAAGPRTEPVETSPCDTSSQRGDRTYRMPLIVSALLIAVLSATFPASPISAAEPIIDAQLVDGRNIKGTTPSIDANVLSLAVDGKQQQFTLDDLLAIQFPAAVGQPTARSWLLLSNGDRAPLSPIDLVDDAFVCRWNDAEQRANWRIPLELVTGLLRQPLTVNETTSLLPELSRRAFTEDTLFLSDGTRLAGALEGVTADSFRVETAVGIVPVETSRVEAIAMNAALVQRPESAERSALVVLRDGSWLTLQDLAIAVDGSLTGQTSSDTELHTTLADVVQIAFYGPRVIDLTQRAPQMVTSDSFVSRKHELLVNRNVRGGWLQLGGRSYGRGFGMTSGMSVTFELETGDRQFQATVGLDDSVDTEGSVVFVVTVDDRRVFTSPTMRGGDAPLAIGPLEIAGGQRLTLFIEFAEFGNVQDVADWCNPVILR
jgi:hypothetical protein